MNGVHFKRRSTNRKTGPIPVTHTSADSCPDSCALKGNGCYAATSFTGMFWRTVSGKNNHGWTRVLSAIRALESGALWRHNVAGDLPGNGETISAKLFRPLVEANRGKSGFTFTHKHRLKRNRELIEWSNKQGFTVNLSANNPTHADKLLAYGIAPVVTVLASNVDNAPKHTPAGERIVVCPAVTHEFVTCASCRLCSRSDRSIVIGFPAHGAASRSAEMVFNGD